MSNEQRLAIAKLLREYKDVFSSGDHDVGLTRAVHHEIPWPWGLFQSDNLHIGLGRKKRRR